MSRCSEGCDRGRSSRSSSDSRKSMRVLYSAIDQQVPAAHGGSVHVTAVAEGLSALGHDVHVLATRGKSAFPAGAAAWSDVSPPFGARRLRLGRASTVFRHAKAFRPDVIIERYYNF